MRLNKYNKIIQQKVNYHTLNHPGFCILRDTFSNDLSVFANTFQNSSISTLDKSTLFLETINFDCKLANEYLALSYRYNIHKLNELGFIHQRDILKLPIEKFSEKEHLHVLPYIRKWRAETFPDESEKLLKSITFTPINTLFTSVLR